MPRQGGSPKHERQDEHVKEGLLEQEMEVEPPVKAADQRSGVPSLIARFPSLSRARAAMVALERIGLDGDEISLLGPGADAARESAAPRGADWRMLRFVLGRILIGAAVGGTAGALAGVAVAAAFGGSTGTLVVGAVGGVLFGATLGAYVAVERSTGFSEAWPLTFHEASGTDKPVWLGVFRDDDQVRETLRDSQPFEVHVPRDRRELEAFVGASGRPMRFDIAANTEGTELRDADRARNTTVRTQQ